MSVLMLALFSFGAFTQNAAYKENLEKAKEYEAQGKYFNAIASYYDAMASEPTEKAEEALYAYKKLSSILKSGKPGYGEYIDEFDIYDGWMDICDEWEAYWKENPPVYFRCGTIEKSELDMETKTGSYNASMSSAYTSKYKELYSVVLEGWKNAYRSEWKGCDRNYLKLNDNPERRKYSISVNVIDAQGKVIYSFFEKESDYYANDKSKDVYKWTIKGVSREKMKEIDSTSCIVKPNTVSWTVNDKKTNYNMLNTEIIELNEHPAYNAVSLVNAFFALKKEQVFVEGGTFKMGSTEWKDEKPEHNVTVSSFYIGKTEVTQAQWKAVMGNNPSKHEGDYRPVENVSWYDVIVYCNKLAYCREKHRYTV